MRKTTTWLVVVMGLVAAGGGEASSLPGFVVAARTDRATYYARGSSRPEVRKIEAYVRALEAQLETTTPHSRYYLYGSPQEVAAGTGHYTAGVTFPSRSEVHSTLSFHRHELVHLVASGLGDPGRFFHEGLAVALGDDRKWRGKGVHSLARRLSGPRSLSQLVETFESMDPEVAYPLAGSFVAWLIDTHGLGRVRAFFRLCAQGQPRPFEEAFGVALDEAGQSWRRSL